uniref:Si:ch73-105b23.6 n=1 Tax=Cyprinodon variegatus TaxID=28743 RepID=A0A3Q2GQ07_CYPVA
MVYGSLHFITFDGSEYSFNALGEFVILRLSSARGSNIFTLQGQIEKLHTAAQGIVEVPVVVRMAAFHQGLGKVVYDNKRDFAVRCLSVNRCAAVYASSLRVVVWRTEGYRQLAAMVEVPQNFYRRTVGLLGLWSSNRSDDFLMSDAVPGPESLLFSSPPTVPLALEPTSLLLESLSPAELNMQMRKCKESMQCVQDSVASGISDLGQQTLDAQAQLKRLALTFNMPPIVKEPAVIHSRVNSQVNVQIVAEDPNRDPITYSLLFPRPPEAFVDRGGFLTWTPLSTQPVQLTVKVSDKETSSLFTPILRVCNCLNGGTCLYDSVAENHLKGMFQVVGCLCPKGFSGKFCGNTTNVCRGKPCFRGLQCQPKSVPDQFTCEKCPDNTVSNGKEGYKCFDYMCSPPFPFPCHKDAECLAVEHSYSCTCKSGFSGDGYNCTIDECADLMACENAKYECMNRPGSFECLCRYKNSKNADGLDDILAKGFTNKFYNISRKDASEPSKEEYRVSVSSDTPHWYIQDYLSRVSPHYEIKAVEVDLDECKAKEAGCVPHAMCINTYGGYRCVCNGTADVDGERSEESDSNLDLILGLVLGIGIPLLLLLLLLAALACFCCRRKTVTGLPHLMPDHIQQQYNPPPFNYADPALQYMSHCSPRVLDDVMPRQR